jgi:hypothetical protein
MSWEAKDLKQQDIEPNHDRELPTPAKFFRKNSSRIQRLWWPGSHGQIFERIRGGLTRFVDPGQPVLLNVYGAPELMPRNEFRQPIPPRCLAPIDFLKIPAQNFLGCGRN